MAVITESFLRTKLQKEPLKEFFLSTGDIITPSAKAFLTERGVRLREADMRGSGESKGRYVTIDGKRLDKKPEHMTQLYGNCLVFKDHPRIVFRGKLDSLSAKAVLCQVLAQEEGLPKLVEKLGDVVRFIRAVSKAEVLNDPLDDMRLCGLSNEEIHEMSHNTKKHFGMSFFFPDYTMGRMLCTLDELRASVRETELAAYAALKKDDGEIIREDIIKGLNRLSSLIWVMMFQYLKGEFNN